MPSGVVVKVGISQMLQKDASEIDSPYGPWTTGEQRQTKQRRGSFLVHLLVGAGVPC